MSAEKYHKLFLLSGPSCTGKTPLKKSLFRIYRAKLKSFAPLVLYTSRQRRSNETEGIDYFYRSRSKLEQMAAEDHYLKIIVHGDLQLLDINALAKLLSKNDVFYEGNTIVSRKIQTDARLNEIEKISVFLSPLKKSEIQQLNHRGNQFFRQVFIRLMRQKLLRRARKNKYPLTPQSLADLRQRADDAFAELSEAHHFDYIIPNHDGEDSDHWDNPAYPEGDAGRSLDALYAILKSHQHPLIEKWNKDVIS